MREAIAAAVQEEREAVLACLHSGADWYCDDARNAIMILAKEIVCRVIGRDRVHPAGGEVALKTDIVS